MNILILGAFGQDAFILQRLEINNNKIFFIIHKKEKST